MFEPGRELGKGIEVMRKTNDANMLYQLSGRLAACYALLAWNGKRCIVIQQTMLVPSVCSACVPFVKSPLEKYYSLSVFNLGLVRLIRRPG